MKVAVVLLLTILSLALASDYSIDLNSKYIVDRDGRVVVSHGVNAIYKLFPFLPITDHFDSNSSLCDADFQNLSNWGFNSIRLFVSWEATNVAKGTMNTTYLEEVKKIVRKAAEYNTTILLDAHEDAVARRFCGEGFPDWAVADANNSFPDPVVVEGGLEFNATGFPTLESCLRKLFFKYNDAYGTQYAWEKLYKNYDGIQDEFAEFWKTVATYFKDEPNVIGYEIINEPYTANFHSNPFFNIPYMNDIFHLTPLYDKVNEKIRQADQNTLLFFEPTVTDDYIWLHKAPGGSDYNNRSVLSFHVYCQAVTPEGEPTDMNECHRQDTAQFTNKWDWAQKHGLAASLTEFGALSNTQNSSLEVHFITNISEYNFNSWYYWQFKYYMDITTAANPGTTESFYFNDGSLQTNKVKALARSYAHKICGDPQFTEFNPATGMFNLAYAPKDCNGKSTEIYLSEDFYYPNGFATLFTGCNGCKLVPTTAQKRYYYEIRFDSVITDLITLTVTPTQAEAEFMAF